MKGRKPCLILLQVLSLTLHDVACNLRGLENKTYLLQSSLGSACTELQQIDNKNVLRLHLTLEHRAIPGCEEMEKGGGDGSRK